MYTTVELSMFKVFHVQRSAYNIATVNVAALVLATLRLDTYLFTLQKLHNSSCVFLSSQRALENQCLRWLFPSVQCLKTWSLWCMDALSGGWMYGGWMVVLYCGALYICIIAYHVVLYYIISKYLTYYYINMLYYIIWNYEVTF